MADPITFTCASWNVHALPDIAPWAATWKRLRRVAERLVSEAPRASLIGIQECWTVGKAADLAAFLRTRGYKVAGPAGKNHGFGTGGLIVLYDPTVWSVAGDPLFTPFRHREPRWKFWGGADGVGNKGFITAPMRHVASGHDLLFVTTHLQSQYGLECDPSKSAHVELRIRQFEQLDRLGWSSKVPVLLTGDFNTFPTEPVIPGFAGLWADLTAARQADERTFAERSRARTVTCKSPAVPRAGFDTLQGGWFDYAFAYPKNAFCGSGYSLIWAEGDEDDFSDHAAVAVTVTWTPTAAPATALAPAVLPLAIALSAQPISRREWLMRLPFVVR